MRRNILIDIPPPSSGGGGFSITSRRAARWVVAQRGVVFPGTPVGISTGSVGFGGAVTTPTATEPSYFPGATTALAGNQARIQSQATPTGDITLGIVRVMEARIQLVQTTQVRCWFCVTDSVTGVLADTPAINICGFRFATTAGDTGWKIYSAAGGAGILVNTGNVADTNGHIFTMVSPGSSPISMFIDGTLVGQASGNLPSFGTPMDLLVSVDNVGIAQIRNINVEYFYYDTI